MFHEPVKFVHIDIYKKLRGEVTEWEANPKPRRGETIDNLANQPQRPFVQIPLENTNKRLVISAREEFPYVALQNPAGFGVVFASLPAEATEAVQCLMCPLPDPTGKRIGDELTIEVRVQNSVYRMMKQAVADVCLVDVPRLRVGDIERLIAAVPIGTMKKVAVKGKDIIHKADTKFLDIRFSALAAQKFSPRFK